MRAAVKSVSQLVDAIKAKFAPAAPGEGGVANPDGSPAVKPAQAGPRGADALKAAGTRNQIAALAFALFREAGAVDGEQGRRAAASLASAEGGVGEEHILGELSRHLAEAQRTLAAARTEMREFFTTGRAAGKPSQATVPNHCLQHATWSSVNREVSSSIGFSKLSRGGFFHSFTDMVQGHRQPMVQRSSPARRLLDWWRSCPA
jgi:hypothetical protein